MSEALLKFMFVQSQYDQITEGVTLVLMYIVDDMLGTTDSLKLIEETKATLQQVFKMKDLRELRYFLGIEFVRYNKRILIHQRTYALELLSELDMNI